MASNDPNFENMLKKKAELSPTTHEWDDQWHGIDEYWFEEDEARERARRDRTYNCLVKENKLLGNQACRVVLAREAPNAGGAEVDCDCKSFYFIRRLPHLSQAEFYYHWTVIHPPIWTKVRRLVGYSTPPKSVKNYLEEKLNSGLVPLGFDSIAEAWHPSFDEMGRAFQTPEHDKFILQDAELFREGTVDVLAIEHVLHRRLQK